MIGPLPLVHRTYFMGAVPRDPTLGFVLCSPVLKFFWPCRGACRILVPRPGIEPVPPAVEAWILNHWTAREAPVLF